MCNCREWFRWRKRPERLSHSLTCACVKQLISNYEQNACISLIEPSLISQQGHMTRAIAALLVSIFLLGGCAKKQGMNFVPPTNVVPPRSFLVKTHSPARLGEATLREQWSYKTPQGLGTLAL